MKKNFYAVSLWAMLCLPSMLIAQTPFYQKCTGEGENNLANFSIQNIIPEEAPDECKEIKECNPYFFQALAVKGECVKEQWSINGQVFNEENKAAFCHALELGSENTIKHDIVIEDEKELITYTATCVVLPAVCCDIDIKVEILKLAVIKADKQSALCEVVISQEIQGDVQSYMVETLNKTIYEGEALPENFQVPCGKVGDMLCFTVKGKDETCEKSRCIMLENLKQGNKILPRVVSDENTSIALNCFPNPANDVLNVNVSLPKSTIGKLRITDFYGKTMYQSDLAQGFTTKQIDITAFHAGNYLIVTTDQQGGFNTQKVVIIK
jgi:hypothetical protein